MKPVLISLFCCDLEHLYRCKIEQPGVAAEMEGSGTWIGEMQVSHF